jgi:multidrug efflux system outer membrane protein
MKRLRSSAYLAGLVISACTLAPHYERPVAPVAKNFSYAANQQAAAGERATEIYWKNFYTEPYLQKLIAIALENNRDLRIATLNIEAAQAQYRIRRADLMPTINVTASGIRTHTPADLSLTARETTSSQYNAGLGISAFELDLFGRVRSQSNAANAEYLATQAAQKSVQISLIAEVAKTYFNLRALEQQWRYAQKIKQAYAQTDTLMQQRFDNGLATNSDLSIAQASLAQAQIDEAKFERTAAQARHGLELLLGGTIPEDVAQPSGFDKLILQAVFPTDLPSTVLVARPDVLQAELQLQAANANIGAARAAFLPMITLTGNYGTASTQLSGLFKSGALSWNFTPQLILPIFDLGRNFSTLDLAHVRKNMAVAQYEKTLQIAFREVADALAAYATLERQLQSAEKQAQAQKKYADLAQEQLRSGINTAFDMLDAQRRSDLAQQALLQLRADYLANRADLYKVLGGGVYADSK